MKINHEFYMEFSPTELANEIWELDSEEQAELINRISDIFEANPYNFNMQLEFVREVYEKKYTTEEIRKNKRMIDKVSEYLNDI